MGFLAVATAVLAFLGVSFATGVIWVLFALVTLGFVCAIRAYRVFDTSEVLNQYILDQIVYLLRLGRQRQIIRYILSWIMLITWAGLSSMGYTSLPLWGEWSLSLNLPIGVAFAFWALLMGCTAWRIRRFQQELDAVIAREKAGRGES